MAENEETVPVERLPESALGTKQHWDDVYERELRNFNDHKDVGEVWFGEDSVERMVRWMDREGLPTDAKVLDLGCGNGILLVELAKEGYSNLHGMDYSQAAIDLARSIARDEELSINYVVGDCLQLDALGLGQFDVITDKGTYDAICLCPDGDLRLQYVQSVTRALVPGGLFIITSCNWTEEELRKTFHGGELSYHSKVKAPTFTFGGQTGQTTSTVIFRRAL
eukprot:comp19142_c1_seq1/m.21803 comp19142_c1_seq1/g.21803  ORF comp19142_c1_seq1/g.21803 comp19142_c1_seq1/m.21803 type:complete len:223 (-) comp19142_c1_seq1:596-1264(-)